MPQILCSGEPLRPARAERAIALGAALLIADLPGLSCDFDLAALAEANPWAVVAVVKPMEQGLVAAWRRHPPLRQLVVLDGPEEEWGSLLRKELTDLGRPEVREMAAYINAACPDPTFQRALLAELQGHQRPVRSTRHAAFTRQGPLTANGWMGLYSVVRFLSFPHRLPLGDAAERLGIDRRTLQAHCRKALELDPRAARQGFGWKWAVERALRLHGYIPNNPPVPLGVRSA